MLAVHDGERAVAGLAGRLPLRVVEVGVALAEVDLGGRGGAGDAERERDDCGDGSENLLH